MSTKNQIKIGGTRTGRHKAAPKKAAPKKRSTVIYHGGRGHSKTVAANALNLEEKPVKGYPNFGRMTIEAAHKKAAKDPSLAARLEARFRGFTAFKYDSETDLLMKLRAEMAKDPDLARKVSNEAARAIAPGDAVNELFNTRAFGAEVNGEKKIFVVPRPAYQEIERRATNAALENITAAPVLLSHAHFGETLFMFKTEAAKASGQYEETEVTIGDYLIARIPFHSIDNFKRDLREAVERYRL